jgi:CubicO group peptidase (beta-lactamase class C family)
MRPNNLIIPFSLVIVMASILFSCNKNETTTSDNIDRFEENYPDFAEKMESKISSIYTENELYGNVIIAIVDEDGLLYSYSMDREIFDGKNSNFDNDTPFYIASSTKSFTGTLLKILEKDGLINLDNPISEYIPDLNYNDSVDTKNISIKSLLNHTHGTFSTRMTWKTAFLGYNNGNNELINDLNTDFLYDPSGNFRYSNVGPIISSIAIENVTGNSWKSEMKEHIFKPLNMTNTSAFVSDYKANDILPSITVSKKQGIIESNFYKQDITMHASGGIISTVNDLSKWLSANIRKDNNLIKGDSWSELMNSTTAQDKTYYTYHRSGYSLGWDIAEYQNEKILTRFGGLAGISFHISFMPEKNIGVIAFTNDNRAYLLPHLIANYGYNIINSQQADSIFEKERVAFDKSFKRENEIEYPTDSTLLISNKVNDAIIGDYHNNDSWPSISIVKMENYYLFKWGILSGKIYENEAVLTSHLGVLSRDFEIKNDTLFTGSLIYKKKNE